MMTFTIAGKELRTLFASPLAWLVLGLLQFIIGYAFLKRLDDFLQIQSQLVQLASPPGVTEMVAAPMFATLAIVFLFAVPVLAMRTIAEERRNQTMVLLLTAPVSITQIVLGKFLGLFVFLVATIALFAAMPLSLAATTRLDYGLLASLVLGVVLAAASFAAVSVFISSLTAHPIAAALGAFGALLAMALMSEATIESLLARNWVLPAAFVQVFAPLKNLEPLGKGLIDTYAIACSLLLTIAFLVLTVRRLDARRLRG